MESIRRPGDADEFSALLAAARAGSGEALGRLLQSYRNYLLLIANDELDPQLRGKAGPSDLVQDALLNAQRDFQQFNGSAEKELLSWLRTILDHKVVNLARFLNAEKRRIDKEVQLGGGNDSGERPIEVAGQLSTPSSLVGKQEDAQRVHTALDQLPDLDRRIVMLRMWEQKPFEQIAAETGQTLFAVQKRWYRAIRKLRDILDEEPNQ